MECRLPCIAIELPSISPIRNCANLQPRSARPTFASAEPGRQSTYFHDSDDAAPATPPVGFNGVLTRKQWRGVIDFASAVNAELVSSFAISAGVRDSDGVWTPVEAEKILKFTRNAGGSIVAAEMFNEPTFAAMGGAPKGYDSVAYDRDFRAFHAFMAKSAPELKVLGPGGVGEGGSLGSVSGMQLVKSEDILKDEGPGLSGFSYHFYGGVSKRCGMLGAAAQTSPETALSDEWLSRTEHDETFYAACAIAILPACLSGSPKPGRRRAAEILGRGLHRQLSLP